MGTTKMDNFGCQLHPYRRRQQENRKHQTQTKQGPGRTPPSGGVPGSGEPSHDQQHQTSRSSPQRERCQSVQKLTHDALQLPVSAKLSAPLGLFAPYRGESAPYPSKLGAYLLSRALTDSLPLPDCVESASQASPTSFVVVNYILQLKLFFVKLQVGYN